MHAQNIFLGHNIYQVKCEILIVDMAPWLIKNNNNILNLLVSFAAVIRVVTGHKIKAKEFTYEIANSLQIDNPYF